MFPSIADIFAFLVLPTRLLLSQDRIAAKNQQEGTEVTEGAVGVAHSLFPLFSPVKIPELTVRVALSPVWTYPFGCGRAKRGCIEFSSPLRVE
jgi:hypothetical protein